MKKYITLLKLKFHTCLQYRGAALAGIMTQFFWGLLEIMIFHAFYKAGVETDITFEQLVTLIWLRQAFYSLTSWAKDTEITELIEKGNIAYEMCRPISIYWLWYCKILSSKFATVLLKCFPIFLLAGFMPWGYALKLPADITSFVLFLISMILTFFLVAGIMNIVYITIFKTISSKGTFTLFYAIASFFSGGQIPIPLMPEGLQKFCYMLPFSYAKDLPYRIYSGNINGTDALLGIGMQVLWIIALIIIGNLMMNKSLKKVVVQGG